MMCANDVDADACFTTAQLQTIEDFYRGPYDSHGTSIIKGRAFGAERGWTEYLPHAGNQMFPEHLYNARDHAAFLFYENDPGVPVPRANDLTYVPDKTATPPEWAWWEFDIDDLTAGKAGAHEVADERDRSRSRAVSVRRDGKLILWHGWNDAGAPPEPTQDYYDEVVATTFDGDGAAARERRAALHVPRHGALRRRSGAEHVGPARAARRVGRERHCAGLRRGARTRPTAASTTSGASARIRKSRATRAPPAAQNDPANWVEGNFSCR